MAVKTGFKTLDNEIGGFKDGHLILLGGRPCSGKTPFAMSLLDNICINGKEACVFFSLEMSNRQFIHRMLNMACGKCIKDLDPATDKASWDLIVTEAKKIGTSDFWLNDTIAISTNEISRYCHNITKKTKLSLIIIDYLQLVSLLQDMPSRQEYQLEIIKDLKKLAVELSCPILLLVQFRGLMGRPSRRPNISDFDFEVPKDYVDDLLLMYRDEYCHKGTAEKEIVEISAFLRDTEEEIRVEIDFLPAFSRFQDISV